MQLTTDSQRLAYPGSGLKRSLACRGLVLVALAAMVGVGPAGAQQSATIQASAVVMPSFVEVAMAPEAGAGVAGVPQPRSSSSPAVADARLVQVRGVPGASIRTVAAVGRDPVDSPPAPGARRLRVVVEYPAT